MVMMFFNKRPKQKRTTARAAGPPSASASLSALDVPANDLDAEDQELQEILAEEAERETEPPQIRN